MKTLYRVVSSETSREKKKYFEEIRMITSIKNKLHVTYKSHDKLFNPYKNADICIVSEDSILTSILIEKLVNYTIKKDSNDIGRQLTISIITSSIDFYNSIHTMKNSFGIVLVDSDLSDSVSTVTDIVSTNYSGPIFLIVKNVELFSVYKDLKISGCVMKNIEVIIKIINKLITHCVMRAPLSDSDDSVESV